MELSKTMLSMLGTKENVGTLVLAIESSIAASFALDGATMTGDEVKRRFNICLEIFKVLRGDMKWGMSRIVDHIPKYLLQELNGTTWTPDTRECWIPSDGT